MPSRTRKGRRARRAAALGVTAVVAGLLPAGAGVPAGASATTAIFRSPGALALDPLGHLWVANAGAFGITEISVATGRLIRVVHEPGSTLNDPVAMTVADGELWVADGGVAEAHGTCSGGLVAVVSDRTGALVRTVDLRAKGLTCLTSIASNDRHVWVSASGGTRLAELSASTGAVLAQFRRGRDTGESSGAVAVSGDRVWYCDLGAVAQRRDGSGAWVGSTTPTAVARVGTSSHRTTILLEPYLVATTARWVFAADVSGPTRRLGGSIGVISAATGRLTRVEQPAAAGYEDARAIASDAAHVWVANARTTTSGGTAGNSIDEFSATTGRLVREVAISDGPSSDPWALASDGRHLFVADLGGQNVLEYSTATGRLVRVIGPAPA